MRCFFLFCNVQVQKQIYYNSPRLQFRYRDTLFSVGRCISMDKVQIIFHDFIALHLAYLFFKIVRFLCNFKLLGYTKMVHHNYAFKITNNINNKYKIPTRKKTNTGQPIYRSFFSR